VSSAQPRYDFGFVENRIEEAEPSLVEKAMRSGWLISNHQEIYANDRL
jgi:hypothetical protein